MTRPKFLRRLESDNPPFSLINFDGSLNERGQRAVHAHRERRPISKRRIKKLHKEALKLDRQLERDMHQQEMEYYDSLIG